MKKKILVFDTELEELSRIHIELLLNNYKVEVTELFAEILPRIKRFKPDVVLLNSEVTGFNCEEVCTTIREKFGLPIVVVGTDTSSIGTCKAIAFIQKPVNKIKLLGTMSQLIQRGGEACCE